MSKHRYKATPLGLILVALGSLIISLTTLHARLLMWEATKRRRRG